MKSICAACRKTFTCVSAFARHRVGSFGEPIHAVSRSGNSRQVIGHTLHERRCLTQAEMLAKGMAREEKAWWIDAPFGNP